MKCNPLLLPFSVIPYLEKWSCCFVPIHDLVYSVRATNNDNNNNFISHFLAFSKYSNCYILQTLILLYLPVRTCDVIGQFCGLNFTVQPAKLQLVSFPTHLIIKTQRYNKYLTYLVFLVCTVSYGCSFFLIDLWLTHFLVGP